MNYLIGISGKAGHGKDSLGDFLMGMFQEDDRYCERIGFADKLKEITADLLDVEYRFVDTQDGKVEEIPHMGNITGRKASCGIDVIFTNDLRFQNEYDCIKKYNGHRTIKPFIIRVVRPDFLMPDITEHSSETGLDHIDDWDYVAVADDLVELKCEAHKIYERILRKI